MRIPRQKLFKSLQALLYGVADTALAYMHVQDVNQGRKVEAWRFSMELHDSMGNLRAEPRESLSVNSAACRNNALLS